MNQSIRRWIHSKKLPISTMKRVFFTKHSLFTHGKKSKRVKSMLTPAYFLNLLHFLPWVKSVYRMIKWWSTTAAHSCHYASTFLQEVCSWPGKLLWNVWWVHVSKFISWLEYSPLHGNELLLLLKTRQGTRYWFYSTWYYEKVVDLDF